MESQPLLDKMFNRKTKEKKEEIIRMESCLQNPQVKQSQAIKPCKSTKPPKDVKSSAKPSNPSGKVKPRPGQPTR